MTDRFKDGTGYPVDKDPSIAKSQLADSWRKSDEKEKKILEEWWTSWSLLLARLWLWLSRGV